MDTCNSCGGQKESEFTDPTTGITYKLPCGPCGGTGEVPRVYPYPNNRN